MIHQFNDTSRRAFLHQAVKQKLYFIKRLLNDRFGFVDLCSEIHFFHRPAAIEHAGRGVDIQDLLCLDRFLREGGKLWLGEETIKVGHGASSHISLSSRSILELISLSFPIIAVFPPALLGTSTSTDFSLKKTSISPIRY